MLIVRMFFTFSLVLVAALVCASGTNAPAAVAGLVPITTASWSGELTVKADNPGRDAGQGICRGAALAQLECSDGGRKEI